MSDRTKVTEPKIPQLESMIYNYLRDVSIYPFQMHPDITLEDTQLVNCLEEDHVSHDITVQEPRPRPMKETLHSRHHSTVLPRLGSNRMESHQNHAVDSAIQLQGNNRVLKKRPPPISDEEQRLKQRQRCTLS